jgi:hypothetical protein
MIRTARILTLVVLILSQGGLGQSGDPPAKANPATQLRLDSARRRVVIQACTKMVDGLIEYGLVGPGGKDHETLFVTDVPPSQIHAACLIVGAPDAPLPPKEPEAPIVSPAAPVRIEVTWTEGYRAFRHDLADLIARERDCWFRARPPLVPGAWIYNASVQGDGFFLADRLGCVIALAEDVAALANHRDGDPEDDDHFVPARSKLPPVGTPVEIHLIFRR